MKDKLWFKAKKYGWGWTPISWQGWLLTLMYALTLVWYFKQANVAHSGSDFLIGFGFNFILLTIPFLAICYLKGEHPHWRWGDK